MANQIKYQVSFDIHKQGLDQLKASLQQIQKLSPKDLMKINQTDLKTAQSMFLDIKTQALNVEDALKKAFNPKLNTVNISEFNRILKDSGSSIDQVYSSFKQAGVSGENAFRNLSSQVLRTNIQLKENHTILDKIAKTFANTIKWNIASAVVNNMSRSIEQAWGYTKSLDSSLNDIRIVTGKSAEEMGNFAVKANEAAQSLGKTTTDYTNAALIYAQQGLSDKEIEERARITLMTANVTGQSASDVSEELTAVWNGYKVNAEEAEVYIDRLAAVAATTASDLEELSTGMSKVASAAAAMGVGEDQLAAQLSTIISVTRQAPESVGTALRTVYARISDIKAGIDEDGVTLGNYSGKMAELGFNVLDAAGNLRDMGEVMEDIGHRWQNLTREQQISLAQTMAGQRQYSNLIALFDNFEKYDEALNTAQNAAGTLQKQQDIYMESTAAHLQTLKAAVENIYDSFVDTDSINGIVDGLTIVANLFANFIDGIGGGINLLKSLGSVGLMVFSQQIAKGINTTISNFEIGRENARQFEESLKGIQNWQNISGLSEFDQYLAKNRELLLELVQLMTPEQFSGMQALLENITQLGNEAATLESQIAPLEDTLKIFSNKDLRETINDQSLRDDISVKIEKQIEDYQNLAIAIENVQNILNKKEPNLPIGIKFEDAKNSAEQYINKIRELKNTDILVNHDKEIQELQQSFKKLPQAVDENTQESFKEFNDFFIKLKELFLNSGIELEQSFEKITNEWNNGGKLVKTFDQIIQKGDSKADQLARNANSMTRAFNIETVTQMAGSITSLTFATQQFLNLGNIWKNQDLSLGEKIFQMVTNFTMSVSMAIPAITNLNKAFKLLKISKLEDASASMTAAAANMTEAGALTATGAAATGATKALTAFSTVLKAHPILATIAVIGSLIFAYDKLTMSTKEAEQALSNFNNKQAELTKNVSSVQNDIKDLQSLKEEYNSLSSIVGSYDQNINALSEKEKDRWNQIKQKIADINPEIIAAYDAQGQIILKNNDALDKIIEKLQKKNQLELESFVNSDDFTNAAKAKSVESKNAKKQVEVQQSFVDNNFGTSLSSSNFGTVNLIIESARKAADITQSEVNEFIELSTTPIQKLEKAQKERYKKLLDLFSNSNNKELSSFASKYKDNLLQFINEYLNAWDSANGQLIAAQNKAQVASNADPAMLVEELIYGNESKANYERLKQAGVQDIEAILSAWADDHKKGMAENWYQYVDQGKKFEENLLSIYDTSPKLISQIKIENEKFKQMTFETQQQRVNYLIKTFNDLIKDNNLQEARKDVLSTLFNFVFGSNLTEQNFNTNTGFIKTLSDSAINAVDDISKYISNQTGDKKNNIFQDLLDINTAGVSWENIQKGLEGITLTTDNWHEILQQVIADQQVIQQQQNNITSLSSISQSGEKLQSGKNLSKKENQAYQENLDSVIETANQLNDKELIKSAELLKNTWLAGSEEYQQALDKVLQKIIEIKTEQANQEGRQFTQEQIADIEKYATTIERINELYQKGTIKDEVHYHALFNKAINEELKTLKISGSTFKSYTDQLKNLRKQTKSAVDGINNLGEQINLSDEALQQMALNDLKLVDSLQKLQKSYKNLKDDLNADPGSMKFMNAMSELVGIINNIPGIHIDLTNENATDYLTNVKEIAQGADGAIQRLRQKLAEQEIEKIQVEAELDERSISVTVLNRLNELIQQLSPEDIQTHAYLQDKVFVDQLNALIRNAGLTADQCNRILSKIGVKANITTRKIALPSDFTPGAPIVGGALANSANKGIKKNPIPSMQEFEIPDKITYEPISSSGSDGGVISNDSGGKSGGGGGGKSSKPDTSQKETKEALKDQVDLYHDINIEIGDLNRKLDNTQKKQDRLYGKDLLNNLNQQNDILDQQIGKLEEKYQLQKQDQTQKQTQLKELGVIFDGYGKIGNYMDLLKTKQTGINELIKKYNELIKQYNETTDETRKKELNQQISELDKKIQHETQKMNNLKKGMDEYDKLMDDMQENEDQREEKRQKQFQNNMKKFRTEIEIRLDMGEAERDWNNFRRNILNHSNILKESDFDKTLKDVTQNYQDVLSYFDVNGQIGSLEALTNQLLATQDELDQINDGGESSIYGDNKKQAMEDLQNDLDELMQQMEDVEGLIDSIDEAYLDTIDDIMDQFDKQIENYELIGDLIEHDIDLLSLLYGDRNYDAMDRYYTTLQNNNLKQLDSLRQQRDFWKEQWDAAVARGDSEAAKKFEENYKETIGNLNSLIEEAAENLKNKYINAIDSIFDTLDKKISGGLGTDYLSTAWQLINKNADEYLDTINSAFAVQQLEDKFRDAINDTKNLKGQQALKKIMDEQLENLRAKEKLTEYDVERAEKLLQIEQARIALEDAQASKTSMRLKRDSQGNYSYEYVADEGNIGEAEQGLAAAQNDLYNFDKDRYQSNLDDMLSVWKDFQEQYKEIVTDVSLSEEERVANLALLREQYGQYINDKTAENLVIRGNLMESAFADLALLYETDVENYNQMSLDEQNILMGDLVPAWESGIQQMADKVAGEGGFIPVCQDAFEEITEATENYKDELDDMARVAEVDLNDVKQGVDVLSDSFSDLVEKNDDLLDRMNQQMDSIEQLKDAVHGLMEEYEDVYQAAKKAASAIHQTLQSQRIDVLDEDDDEDDTSSAVTTKKYPTPRDLSIAKYGYYDPNMGVNNSGKNYASDESLSNGLYYNNATGEIETGLDWWLKKKSASSNSGNHTGDIWKLIPYETGGYTGTWAGNEGKIALLHQKELVLNSNDTKNLLDTITILKSVTDSLNGNLYNRMSNLKSGLYNSFNNNDKLEQNVHIEASFPNVDSKREIEEALSDLVNLAAQRAMKR